jgi:hypothetical protein
MDRHGERPTGSHLAVARAKRQCRTDLHRNRPNRPRLTACRDFANNRAGIDGTILEETTPMSGPIVRTGTTPKFWQNWDQVFGNKGGKKSGSSAAKTAGKKPAKSAKKASAKAAAGKKAQNKRAQKPAGKKK